jgi:hypothetical protein
MSRRIYRDLDDGFDDESFLEDDEFDPDHSHKRREHRQSDRTSRSPRDDSGRRRSEKPLRRRELASLKAWGAPY